MLDPFVRCSDHKGVQQGGVSRQQSGLNRDSYVARGMGARKVYGVSNVGSQGDPGGKWLGFLTGQWLNIKER